MSERNEWKDAVIDALVVNWHYRHGYEDSPREAVAALISSEITFALDPAISENAVMLVQRGRQEAVEIVTKLREAAHAEWEAGEFKDRFLEGWFFGLTAALSALIHGEKK